MFAQKCSVHNDDCVLLASGDEAMHISGDDLADAIRQLVRLRQNQRQRAYHRLESRKQQLALEQARKVLREPVLRSR